MGFRTLHRNPGLYQACCSHCRSALRKDVGRWSLTPVVVFIQEHMQRKHQAQPKLMIRLPMKAVEDLNTLQLGAAMFCQASANRFAAMIAGQRFKRAQRLNVQNDVAIASRRQILTRLQILLIADPTDTKRLRIEVSCLCVLLTGANVWWSWNGWLCQWGQHPRQERHQLYHSGRPPCWSLRAWFRNSCMFVRAFGARHAHIAGSEVTLRTS
jgi:hypothetical protein